MPSSQSGSTSSGAENEDEPQTPSVEQGSRTDSSVGEQSSSDEELGTNNLTTPGQGASDNRSFHVPSSASLPSARRVGGASTRTSCSSCQSSCLGQCVRTGAPIPPSGASTSEGYPSGSEEDNLRGVFDLDAQLEALGKDVERVNFIAEFFAWITESDFLHAQELEPIVGGPPPTNYPAAVDTLGIRGLSVYTALFHHLDMEVLDYSNPMWAALWRPSGAVGTPTRDWALDQDGNDLP